MQGGAWNLEGSVAALSLWLTFYSLPNGEELYFRSAGVQVLAGLQRTGVVRKQWATVTKERILGDEARSRQSVRLALEPLLKDTAATATRVAP
jgi:hypothetical protein